MMEGGEKGLMVTPKCSARARTRTWTRDGYLIVRMMKSDCKTYCPVAYPKRLPQMLSDRPTPDDEPHCFYEHTEK